MNFDRIFAGGKMTGDGFVERTVGQIRRLRFPLRGTTVGAVVTAFSIYSHTDTFLNLSAAVHRLATYWREIIALPWIWMFAPFQIQIPKTISGMFTVLLATALVVRSSWRETGGPMPLSIRAAGLAICALVGSLYSTLIIVPALYDANAVNLTSVSFATEILAALFYENADAGDAYGPVTVLLVWFGIVVLYCAFLAWHLMQAFSHRSLLRSRVAVVLPLLFALFLLNYAFIGYEPFNALLDDPITTFGSNALTLVAILFLLFSPYVASIYMADPLRIIQRNTSIFAILVSIFIIDRCALLIEFLGSAIVGLPAVK